MKKILFAASEAVPFVKTGGLADVIGSLPKYFNREKYDVRVILPKYVCMEEEFKNSLQYMFHYYVDLGWRKQYAGILEMNCKGIIFYFIDNEFYFAGSSPYAKIHEDIEKFAFFSKAVLEALPKIGFCPDIIHCHDWQTGLIPVFLKNAYHDNKYYEKIKTVYSIHNLQFQGRWNYNTVMDITGLPKKLFTPDGLESYGEANYLKGGVIFSDAVTTVSKSYAIEIMGPEVGEGLDGVLRKHGDKLYGITNGLDYSVYDPQKDAYISKCYGIADVTAGKAENKKNLQKEFGLKVDQDAFLIGMVSRMTEQKGFDLVDCVLEEILESGRVQLVVLGTGEEKYQSMFRRAASIYPKKLAATIGYSEETAHRIYASCDAFLMPSRFEPCGLSQLISLRYGTVPIVRETGGLRDTVEPYNEYWQTGTGFGFLNYNAQEMLKILRYAKTIYDEKRIEWLSLIKHGMEADFSWNSSASEYELLYDKLMR